MPGVGREGGVAWRSRGAVAAAARAGLDEKSHSPAAHVEEQSEQRCWGVGGSRPVTRSRCSEC